MAEASIPAVVTARGGFDGDTVGELLLGLALAGQPFQDETLFLGDALEGTGLDHRESLPHRIGVGRAKPRAHDPKERRTVRPGLC